MASLPARVIDAWLLRPLDQLLSRPQPVKVRLDTGLRLARVELITDPPYEIGVDIPPEGAEEVRIEGLPECLVKYIDHYDQYGRLFLQVSFRTVVFEGSTLTIPLRVSVSTT